MIPIFVITCDRLKVLKDSMQSYYDFIKTPFEIVIVDFGSSYKPTVEYLKNLEHEKIKVYWKGKIVRSRRFNLHIDEAVQDYFKDHPMSNYVVTDSDILLDNVDGDILEAYAYFLDIIPQINVVGPMLRIDDIPKYYPLREGVVTGKHKKFHSAKVHTANYKEKQIRYISAKIDTTFGMYRERSQWRRLQKGIRTFVPYSAKHLDWYVDPRNLTEDQRYYMQNASQIAHWSKWDSSYHE